MPTNKEILERLDDIESKLPNGEITHIRQRIRELHSAQQEHTEVQKEQFEGVHKSIRSLEKRLYNPEDGIIVKLNTLTSWKGGVTKALWIVFGALVTIVGAMIRGNT